MVTWSCSPATWRWARPIDWLRAWAPDRLVLYVLGNHEFYRHALPDLVDEVRAAAGPETTLLENDEAVDGVRFLGCTL